MNQQNESKNERDHGKEIHRLPQLLAGLDVKGRQAEEKRCEQQHHEILHRGFLNSGNEISCFVQAVILCTRMILAWEAL